MMNFYASVSRAGTCAGLALVAALAGGHSAAAAPCTGATSLVTNPGAGLASLNVALAVDFFATSATPLVTAAPNAKDSPFGVWGRGVGGQSTTTTNTTLSTFTGCSARVQTSYAGFQTGLDYALPKLGSTDWTGHFGLTVGSAWARPALSPTDGSLDYSVPFLGVYTVLRNGNFFSHLQVRHGWHTVDINNPALGLNGSALNASSWDFSGSAGYRLNFDQTLGALGPLFAEPSLGLNVSTTAVDSLTVPGSGIVTINPVVGVLGTGGVRFGTTFTAADLTLQPYALANVWHEFSDNITARFLSANPVGQSVGVSMSRIGTFGQFGGGMSALLPNGLLTYIRADYRTGNRTEGWAIAAGLRYAF